jgi:hypothetical protein
MDLMRPGWYIADLDAETVANLESQSTVQRKEDSVRSVVYGRGRLFPFLKSFYISDKPLLNALRLLAWLVPCPELSGLLIDWARSEPSASFSPLLGPMLDHLVDALSPPASVMENNYTTTYTCRDSLEQLRSNMRQRRRSLQLVRKLAFAQHILSGAADSGAWGGEARSDIAVRVYARNAECCRILDAFVEEVARGHDMKGNNSPNAVDIAIIYGVYHMADLTRRLREHGFSPARDKDADTLTAWNIPLSQTSALSGGPSQRTYVPAAAFAFLYLAVNAIDWWVLFQLLAQLAESMTQHAHDFNSAADSSAGGIAGAHPVVVSAGQAVGYAILYVLRHNAVLRSLSYSAVHWDRGLFADHE